MNRAAMVGAQDFPEGATVALGDAMMNECGSMVERPGLMPTLWGIPGYGVPERKDFVPGPFFFSGNSTAGAAGTVELTGQRTTTNWGQEANMPTWLPADGDFLLLVTRYRWHIVAAAEANLTGALAAAFIRGLTWTHVANGQDVYVFPSSGYSRSLIRPRAMELAVAANEVAPEIVEPVTGAWYNLAIARPICPKTDAIWQVNVPNVATNVFTWILEIDGVAVARRAINVRDPMYSEDKAFRWAILARLVSRYGPIMARQILGVLRS